ncbi:MAG: acetylornithine/succinylornithine family transaminase [Parasporobacterium sp.]|nr:acetylornithine/succinylornithine family transaminase [Parasporobacterium sp.]
MSITDIDQKYVAGTYKRFPVEIISGKGSVVKDTNGKEYIDLGSGIAVTSFGIADEQWQEAVKDQIEKVQHTSNLYYTEPCVKLAQMLCERTGMKKVFFSNSGAEANECAIKVARKYSAEKKGPDCFTIVTLRNSFHGRTLTTLAATGQDHFHELFQPLTPGFEHVDANDIEQLKKLAETTQIAGIMIECVQGEGGVNTLEKEYLEALSQFVKENDIPLIIDEVQTGNGRTGELYAYMNFALEPDIVSTAKGLAGGLPMGATLMNEKMQDILGAGDHGSTFGGNPVCAAAAISIISRIDRELLDQVKAKSAFIFQSFEGAPGIESVSGLGLMIGIKTEKPAGEVVAACMEKGVLCLTAKDKVRLLPALNIPMVVLEKAVEVIKEAAVS